MSGVEMPHWYGEILMFKTQDWCNLPADVYSFKLYFHKGEIDCKVLNLSLSDEQFLLNVQVPVIGAIRNVFYMFLYTGGVRAFRSTLHLQ